MLLCKWFPLSLLQLVKVACLYGRTKITPTSGPLITTPFSDFGPPAFFAIDYIWAHLDNPQQPPHLRIFNLDSLPHNVGSGSETSDAVIEAHKEAWAALQTHRKGLEERNLIK